MGVFFRQLLDIITYPIRALLLAPGKFLESSRRLSKLSLPARIALVTAVFLIICVAVSLIAFWRLHGKASFVVKAGPRFWVVVTILVLVIPVVLYKVIQVWLERESSPFPDIESAWQEGLAALEQEGIDLLQCPLFLVLGSSGSGQEKMLFDTAQLELGIRAVPAGEGPLRWYATPRAIYVVLSKVGRLSALARLWVAGEEDDEALVTAVRDPIAANPANNKTLEGFEFPAGRAEADDEIPDDESSEVASAPRSNPGNLRTLDPGDAGGFITPAPSPRQRAKPAAEKRVFHLADAEKQDARLAYLSRLARRSRQPVCPLNGILTLLPFGLIQRSSADANTIQQSLRADLKILNTSLEVRCPVVVLTTGLEKEKGFRELVKRVGPERASQTRFGKGTGEKEAINPPEGDALRALAAHACGAFETWVYTLFRQREHLGKAGNSRLFALLCKVRRAIINRLSDILETACAGDEDSESMPVGGCYFGAVGTETERQGFIRAVLEDRMLELEAELEWTRAAIRRENTFHWLSRLALALDTAILGGMVVFAVMRWK